MLRSKKHDPKVDRLRNLEPFRRCTDDELGQLAQLLEETHVEAGDVLMEQGAPGREFFVIERGLASVSIDGRVIATLGPGEVVGEMSMVKPAPRSATVTAKSEMTLFVAPAHRFTQMFSDAPPFGLKMFDTVVDRLRAAESAPGSKA